MTTKTFNFTEYLSEKISCEGTKRPTFFQQLNDLRIMRAAFAEKSTPCVSKFCFLFKWFDTFNDFLTAFLMFFVNVKVECI